MIVPGLIALALLQAGPSGEEHVTVTAERFESARTFVADVTQEQQDQIPLWEHRICIGVSGLRGEQAQFVADRISAIALDAGVGAREPGCDPDVLVMFSANAGERAEQLVRGHGRLLGVTDGHTLGRGELEAFASTPRPVRWWHVSERVSMDGDPRTSNRPSDQRIGRSNTPSAALSRLRQGSHLALDRVTIIVDAQRVNGVQLGVVTDYVAMAALAQIDPDADTSAYDTILNAFRDGGAGPSGITAWDRAFLRGLYSASADTTSVLQRQADIARGMLDHVE